MEAEKLQAHDEFVYYDSARSHTSAFRCLCCPHDGKITSERILYSAQKPFPRLDCSQGGICAFPKWLCEVLGWPWVSWLRPCSVVSVFVLFLTSASLEQSKKKEQVDIDHVTDVTVEQSCTEVFAHKSIK